MPNHRHALATQRLAERREREDGADKLHDQVPALTSLRLEIEERRGAGATTHTRHVVVDRAPTLFLLPCGDPQCVDGEHDITTAVMKALRAGETSFRGSDACGGSIGPSPCLRVIHFVGTAKYRDGAGAPGAK